MASRPTTPALISPMPKHGASKSQDVDVLGGLNISKSSSMVKVGPDVLDILEAKANGL